MSGEVELRALAEAATPGPWTKLRLGGWIDSEHPDLGPVVDTKTLTPDDAAYIAAANPAVVLALLDRLEAAEGAVERVRSSIPQVLDMHMDAGEGCICHWRRTEADDDTFDAHLAEALLAALTGPRSAEQPQSDQRDRP